MRYLLNQKSFRRLLLVACAVPWSLIARGQSDTLTIEDCYRMARENYPQIRKKDLISKTSAYTVENAGKAYLPQLSFSGQASYQSQTIDFAAALGGNPALKALSSAFPKLSKDQYKIQGDVSQNIYDGGASEYQKEYTKAQEAIDQQSLEVSLYALRDRVTHLFFSVLLMDEQYKQNEVRKADLQSEISKAEAALQNGTSFRSNVDELKAEFANNDMSGIELKANRNTYLQILSIFIGKPLNEHTLLTVPAEKSAAAEITRPELKLYDLQKSTYKVREKQLSADYTPRLSAFFSGAYGRPTLNFLDNNFGPWYITGIRLNWSLSSLYALKNNKRILNLGKQSVDIDKETFLKNANMDLARENGEIKKYRDLLQQDEVAVGLRASVKKSAQAQLANGVITVHEYISQVNAENLARQTQILHHIQLLQAQYQFNYISGNNL